MAELKTKANEGDVTAFLNTVEDEKKRKDCFEVLKLMQDVSGEEPKMWGPAIVGYGKYHYKYESGHEGDFFRTGFSPRKANLTLYIMAGFDRYEKLMQNLGKYKTGKSCLYIKSLADIDRKVLRELIQASLEYMEKKYGR